MPRSGGAAIHMRQNFNQREDRKVLDRLTCLVGNADSICNMASLSAREPFEEEIVDFLNAVSRRLMREAKDAPDLM